MLSTYSYSSLDTYRVCPRKFKYTYIEKVSTVPKITADTYLGTVVHRVLKELYTLGADGILMPKEDAVKQYIGLWEKLNRKVISVTSEYYTVDDYIRIGQEMLIRHYDRYQPFNQGTLLGAEMHIAFQLEGTPFKFKSYIDRLWKREDGTVEICDYKTGQSLTQPGEPRFFYQMGLYQLAVQANFSDIENVELAQYFLRKDLPKATKVVVKRNPRRNNMNLKRMLCRKTIFFMYFYNQFYQRNNKVLIPLRRINDN